MVVLSTAHPAKFPEAVEKATGVKPPMPDALARLMKKAEFLQPMLNDLEMLKIFLRNKTKGR
jgi:threonine synthase